MRIFEVTHVVETLCDHHHVRCFGILLTLHPSLAKELPVDIYVCDISEKAI
jgi:hypothetical protein